MDTKFRILVLDDDAGLSAFIQEILESKDYFVECSGKGKEAIELARKHRYDIALIDIKLPDISGIEVVREIGKFSPLTEFIYITSHAELNSAIEAVKQERVVSYETKPINTDHLLSIIKQITERKNAEKALNESEAKYRKIIDAANDAIFIADAKTGIIIDANKRAKELIGLPLEQIIGMHQKQLHPEDEVEQYKKLFNYHILNGNTISEDLSVYNRKGFMIPVEISASVLELNGKKVIQSIFRDITKRKLVKEKLQRLYCAVEQNLSTVMITDVEGNIEYVNPRFIQLTGYTCEEVIGQNPRILKSGKTSTKTYKELWENISTGEVWRGEFCNKKKNGELYWVSASISPIKNDKGIITHFVAIKEDITGQKRLDEKLRKLNESLEQRVVERTKELSKLNERLRLEIVERNHMAKVLQKSEEKYKTYINNSPNGIFVINSKGKYLEVNEAACLITGYTETELLSMSIPDLVSPEALDTVMKDFEQLLSGGKAYSEAHCKHKDGSKLYLSINATRIEKDKYIGFCTDTTERRRMEEILRNSEARLNEAQQMANIGYWDRDVKNNISHWSEQQYRIFGLKQHEIEPSFNTVVNSIHPDDRKAFLEANRRCLDEGEKYDNQYRIIIPDGSERIIHSRARLIQDTSGNVTRMLGTVQDITERKKAEEQIKASLREKELLLNEIHHRVKNNLQIISSFLDLSSMETGDQNTIDLLKECRNRIDSMAIIHSQLYKSDKFDQIDMKIHAQELSERLLQIYAMEKTIELDIKCNDVCLAIDKAIPCALILNELISNVLKHAYCNKEKGTLCISIQIPSNGNLIMNVKDDGVGIPEELDINRSRSLGLTLVRNLVYKQLKGNMQIMRNGGTEFIIDFKALENKEE